MNTGTAPRSSPSRPATSSRRSCSTRNGSDFAARLRLEPARQRRRMDRPIVAEVGPDGNVWVIDWYNYIVQHNPTPHGFKTGKGRSYETPASRQDSRPDLPRRL